MYVEHRYRRNTSAQWNALNPILEAGEPGYESDTGTFKMGDGNSTWLELDPFIPTDDILALVNENVAIAIGGIVIDSGGVSTEQFVTHIDSDTPHPVYDSGASFILLYQNAKV